ncbi:MAG: glycosyltransferase [Candidatus Omnitrophota bacterium]
MRGDKLLIRKYHIHAATELSRLLTPKALASPSRYIISVSGESGTGKTEITYVLSKLLNENKIKTIRLNQDDYFNFPPKTNFRLRRKDISIVGSSEVKLALMEKHLQAFKDPKITKIQKPLIDYPNDTIGKEILKFKTAKVLLVDGTYTGFLNHIDKRIFLSRTYKDTIMSRKIRKREEIDEFDAKILRIEHKIISEQKKNADLIVNKNYSVIPVKRSSQIKRICMLSIHGYVDPHPILGKTDTGGQVTYVLELSKALARTGIKVDIYTRQFQRKKAVENVAKNVRIIRIPCGGKKFIPKEKISPCLHTFVDNMEKFIRKNKLEYNIYHSHYWDAGYVAMRLTERLNHFFVHTFHSLGAWKKEQMGGDPAKMEKLYNFKQRIKYEKEIFKKVRALVMTSSDMIARSKKFYNYTEKNYIVVPAGVNIDFFRPLKKHEKEKTIDVPQNYIFWVGRFATNKGLDYLLRAFAEIVTKAKDLFLVIGGGSQLPSAEEKKLKKELYKIIDYTKIKNRIFFTKHIPDKLIPAYYRKARIFVLPSKFEPFGMTGAEAIACGTATIVSDRAGLRKYLKHKQNCLIVNPANKKELASAFKLLSKNSKLREKISKNGLTVAKNDFSWEKIAGKSLSFYNKIT